MSILKVARMGHPVLRRRARDVEKAELSQPSIQKFIDDMIDTMHEYHGVGLAAPQVHEGLRIFVAAINPHGGRAAAAGRQPLVFVNPVITPVGADTFEDWEGCLSIPDLRGRVPRARAITVAALDRTGGTGSNSRPSISPPGSFSTRRIISMACCFSIGCGISGRCRFWMSISGTGQGTEDCRLQIADCRLRNKVTVYRE